MTVPANFDQRQKAATMEAARLAGLKIVKLISEPAAAAVAYEMKNSSRKKILVYDFGGGTFDVAIARSTGLGNLEILSSSGHKHLGGQDIDQLLMRYAISEYNQKGSKKFPEHNWRVMKRLRDACIKAKITLSTNNKSTQIISEINDDYDECVNVQLTQDKFNKLCDDLFKGTLDIVDQALKLANMEATNIDHVLLVGGSTKIPRVKELMRDKFGNEKLVCRINPDEAIACGAAIVAYHIQSGTEMPMELQLQDIVHLSIGCELRGGLFHKVINRGEKFPLQKTLHLGTVVDNQHIGNLPIYEGERLQTKYNVKIGEVTLNFDNQTIKRGHNLKAKFEIDENGTLSVSVIDEETRRQIQYHQKYDGSGQRDTNIEKIVTEAEANRADDERFETLIKLRESYEDSIHIKKDEINRSKISPVKKAIAIRVVEKYLNWSKQLPDHDSEFKEMLKKFQDEVQIYTS
ncbi:hypothetical protein WR25_09299 [Diploscapter pachys]|uniref:Uncharacterized protein n=1 Tax=Diploscapter pachys TaxID=2018661 RepID=A0A2A2L0L0_9BILA|nr:hypothetical protein WR25_09299 [Diploscapter pachys]